MINEIVNSLLNKNGISICVLDLFQYNDRMKYQSIMEELYWLIPDELFLIKNRQYAKLINGSTVYFVDASRQTSMHGLKFNKIYCRERLSKEQISYWYTTLAPTIVDNHENLGAEFQKILYDNLWELYEN